MSESPAFPHMQGKESQMMTSAEALHSTLASDDRWLEVTPGERFRIRTSVDETGGTYSMIEIVAEPRNGVPLHIHTKEDEHFLVLEGTLHMVNGDERLDVAAGSAVTVKKGAPHAWCNLADTPVRMLIVLSPGHIEAMFRRLGSQPSAELDRIATVSADQFGTVIIGPAIAEGIYTFASPRRTGTLEA
jgi:mannose-6-phosphate isomerase-like protein (cupin superfamily)